MTPVVLPTKNTLRVWVFLMLGHSKQQIVQTETICSLFLTHALVKYLPRTFDNCFNYSGLQQRGCENYRPISITPIFAKRFERVLLNQFNGFKQKEKILNGTKFGFQKHKSSANAVFHLIEAF